MSNIEEDFEDQLTDDAPESYPKLRAWVRLHKPEYHSPISAAERLYDIGVPIGVAERVIVEEWPDPDANPEDVKRMVVHGYSERIWVAGRQTLPVDDWGGDAPKDSADGKPLFEPTPYVWKDPKKIPLRRYLYGHVYQRGFVTLTSAAPGVGKSAESRVECAAVASAKPLLGITPTEQTRTWYWNGEDPLEELERGFAAINVHYGLTKKDLEGWLYTDSGRDVPIKIATMRRNTVKIATPISDALIEALRAKEIGLLVIDPFVTTHNVNENDNAMMNAVMDEWRRIADASGCAIGLVHHTRKLYGEGASAEASRGASAVNAAARIRRVINPMTKAEAERTGVPEDDYHRYFSIDYRGSTFIPGGSALTWCRFASVNLGNGDCGDGDEVGVVEAASLSFDLRPGDEEAALDAIREGGRWLGSPQAGERWVGVPIASALALNAEDKNHRTRLRKIIADWLARGLLREEVGRDEQRKERTFIVAGEVPKEEDYDFE